MKIVILLCVIVGSINAKPNGYYRQEYQFKKSSSSYQNNELQTKNDDEGFYSKHGDLEGNTAPKVNQHSEHREFVNPRLSGNGGHVVTTYNNRDLTDEAEQVFQRHNLGMHGSRSTGGIQSYGASEGTSDGSFGTGGTSTGDQTGKSHSYSSYSSWSSSSSHAAQPHTYQVQSNLAPLTQNVENELSQQLRNAIVTFQKQSAYRSHALTSDDFKILEDELKANLTRQLNEALLKKYGQQGKSGSVTYTITTSGVRSPQANYDNQELTDLSRQLEENLLKQLHEGIRTVHTQTTTQHRTTGTRYVNRDGSTGNRYFTRDSAEVEDLNKPETTHTQTASHHRTNTYYGGGEVSTQTRRPVIRYTIRPTYVNNEDDNVQSTEKISYASIASGSTRHQPTQFTQLHVETEQSGIRTDSYSPGQANVYQRPYTPVMYEQSYPKPSSHATDRERITGYSHTSTYQENFPTIQTERITVNPSVRLVDVAQNVQNDLSTQLNSALRTYEEQFTNSDYQLTHSRPDFQQALENFKHDLKNNITRHLQDEVRRNYGTQVQRGEYSFSSGSRTVANYRVEDLENLRQQIENNLIGHLENSIKQQEKRYSSRSTQTSTYYTSGRTNQAYNPSSYDGGSYTYYPTKPATNTHTSQVSYTSSSTSHAPNELQDITHQVQEDLSEQLREAVRRQSSSGYTSSSYTSQSNQQMVDDLTEELRRNLTKSLEESLQKHYGQQGVKGGYSYTVSTSGVYSPKANYNKQDLNALMQQMQADLERQLREQMQSSYSQSHYTSSMTSGSSNYRPSRFTSQPITHYQSPSQSAGFQKYSQFEQYGSGGDCTEGADANPRYRRSLNMDQQSEEDLGQQVEDLDQLQQEETEYFQSPRGGYRDMVFRSPLEQEVEHYHSPRGGYRNVAWRGPADQEVEHFQSPRGGYRNVAWTGPVHQEVEHFHSPHGGYRNVAWRGQETEHFQTPRGHSRNVVWRSPHGDLHQFSQQTEDYYGQSTQGKPAKSQEVGQEVESFQQPLNQIQLPQQNARQQEVDDYDYENLEVGNGGKQKQVQGQQIEQEIMQQTENEDLSQFQAGKSHKLGQQVEEFGQEQQTYDVEQKFEDSPQKRYEFDPDDIDFEKLEVGSSQRQKDLPQIAQQSDDTEQQIEDLTGEYFLGQQTEESSLNSGKNNKQVQSQQEDEDWHLSQQAEQSTYLEQKTEDVHHGQQTENLHLGQETEDLGQETENLNFVQKPEDCYMGQETENSQQSEDIYLGQETEDFQHAEEFQSGQQVENLGQKSEDFHLGQETEQDDKILGQQTVHFGQQSEDFHLGQATEDLHLGQETEDQSLVGSDLTQQTEDDYYSDNRHSYNSAYRHAENTVAVDELTQQLPHDFLGNVQLGRGNTMSDNKDVTHLDSSGGLVRKPQPFYPSSSLNYGSQQHEDEDLVQNQESFEYSSHQRPTYEDNYRTAHVSRYNHPSYSQTPMETQQVEDFQIEEEQIKPKVYYPLASQKPHQENSYVRLADVLQSPPQGRSLSSSPSDYHGQSQSAVVEEVLPEKVTQPPVEETTSGEPGFWKKLGGKIKTTYNSAKQKAKDLVDKMSKSDSD